MNELSEWRAMWMVVMFDLPVITKKQKTDYRHFHEFLIDDGFTMMQYSVYGRHCATREKADAHLQRVRRSTPPQGEVRVLRVTEAQFARMAIFRDRVPTRAESVPKQLEFW